MPAVPLSVLNPSQPTVGAEGTCGRKGCVGSRKSILWPAAALQPVLGSRRPAPGDFLLGGWVLEGSSERQAGWRLKEEGLEPLWPDSAQEGGQSLRGRGQFLARERMLAWHAVALPEAENQKMFFSQIRWCVCVCMCCRPFK